MHPPADGLFDFAQATRDYLDWAALGAREDRVNDVTMWINQHELGAHRADVDAQIGIDLHLLAGKRERSLAIAQQRDALHVQRRGGWERKAIALSCPAKLIDAGTQRARLGVRVGGEQRGSNGADGFEAVGHEQVHVAKLEEPAQRADDGAVGGHAAGQCDGGDQWPPLYDGGFEVAHHRVAKTAQNFRRRKALLLGVNHVTLGKNAATPGDLRRAFGLGDDGRDLLDLDLQAPGLLIEKRAGAGGAIAVAAIIDNAERAAGGVGRAADVAAVLAADLEDRACSGVQVADAARGGLKLVARAGGEIVREQRAARARASNATVRVGGQKSCELIEQSEHHRLRLAARAAGAGDEDGHG